MNARRKPPQHQPMTPAEFRAHAAALRKVGATRVAVSGEFHAMEVEFEHRGKRGPIEAIGFGVSHEGDE